MRARFPTSGDMPCDQVNLVKSRLSLVGLSPSGTLSGGHLDVRCAHFRALQVVAPSKVPGESITEMHKNRVSEIKATEEERAPENQKGEESVWGEGLVSRRVVSNQGSKGGACAKVVDALVALYSL